MKKIVSAYLALLMALLALVLMSCEKEITVDLPAIPNQIVVEGTIEQGLPPLVLLTWSQGYFDPTDLSTLANLYVRGADVRIWNGTDTIPLIQICSDELTDEQLEQAAVLLGIPAESLRNLSICAYFTPAMVGELNRTYTLLVDYQEHSLRSTTKINQLVNLDSLWFRIVSEAPNDSLGFIYGVLTDPDTTGNAYRWFAQRINHYPQWVEDEELRGQQKDAGYIAPIGSVFDDSFFNGLSFEFAYYRGFAPNSPKFDDQNVEAGFFKRGDTVAVRGAVIDRGVFNFIRSLENQASNQGSPFALPANLQTNITGGLGVWAGYGAVYDTVICR
jgi:hypothetical protein